MVHVFYYKFFLWLSIISLVAPTLLLYVRFNRQPLSLKWLALHFTLSLTCDLAGIVLIYFRKSPNIAGSIYHLFSIFLMSMFFYYSIQWRSLKKLLIGINVIYFLFGLINLLYVQKDSVNSYSQTFQSILILALSIVFFYKLLKELPAQQLQRMPHFWIISGFFFSYSGKLVIYSATYYLITFIQDNLVIVWTIHNLLTTFANLLITYGVWLNHRELTLLSTPAKTMQDRI